MAREVGVDQFVARLSGEDRQQVNAALADGMGVARYGDWNLSYGKKGAAIETRFPPSMFNSSELGDFVAPAPTRASKRSPLLDAVAGPPQIHRPRVSPTVTEYPEVQLETRVSPHPRGNSGGGFIDARRFAPGREVEAEPVEQQRELSEGEAWLAQRL